MSQLSPKPPRMARCSAPRYRRPGVPYAAACKGTVPASPDLPFFKALPREEQDEYYCGCWGWD